MSLHFHNKLCIRRWTRIASSVTNHTRCCLSSVNKREQCSGLQHYRHLFVLYLWVRRWKILK